MKLRSGALLIGLSIVLVSLACSTETIKEVPVDRIVTRDVIKEVPVEKIVEVEKTVIQTVEVEKPVEVIREVVREVQVPGKTVVVEVEKEVVRTVEVEKPVIVTQILVATPTAVPVGAGPSGELRIAEADIAFPNVIPCKFAYNPMINIFQWSILDFVYYFGFEDPGINLMGLGESWSYNPDQTVLTWNIRKGVEFDGGWGEVKAQDWEWSWNQQHCEGTLHSNIFISGSYTKKTNVVDDYTIEFHQTEPNLLYFEKFTGISGFAIFSKNKFDTLGEQKADRNLSAGTGPFKLVKWNPGDEIVTEARPDHYRKVPEYMNVRILEIPEAATQVAALMAREIDVADLAPTEAGRAEATGINILKVLGDGNNHIIYQGRFCYGPQGVLDDKGNPVPDRPGYDPSKPWVGSCDPDSQEWENARKVRTAVGLALDRQSILDTIQGGFGRLPLQTPYLYGAALNRYGPMAEARGLDWKLPPYDPAAARALLAEAGYPNGFDVTMRVTTGSHPNAVEMGEAIVTMLKDVGINVSIEVLTYTGNRPAVVNRERGDWWLQSGSGEPPQAFITNPVEIWALRRNPEAAFNTGFELPQAVALSKAGQGCTTQECVDEARIAMYDWWTHDQGYTQVLLAWGAMGLNPDKIAAWPQPLGLGQTGTRFYTEYVQKPR
ncbi:MAG: ABC transporter substrate-binding protein [Chloroflexi bacterium]|nr:ABC transporter substrate-binding protein [Chloroflexota bacterium]